MGRSAGSVKRARCGRLLARLVAGAAQHREVGIPREQRICHGSFAEAERGAATRLDDARMAACPAQTWRRAGHDLAERVGFEPTKSFDSALFKSAAINRSATSPRERIPGLRGIESTNCGLRPLRCIGVDETASRRICLTDVAWESTETSRRNDSMAGRRPSSPRCRVGVDEHGRRRRSEAGG
jgi:hypothetical protein